MKSTTLRLIDSSPFSCKQSSVSLSEMIVLTKPSSLSLSRRRSCLFSLNPSKIVHKHHNLFSFHEARREKSPRCLTTIAQISLLMENPSIWVFGTLQARRDMTVFVRSATPRLMSSSSASLVKNAGHVCHFPHFHHQCVPRSRFQTLMISQLTV